MNSANPNNSPDQVKEAANHLRGIKNAVQGSFPNLGQVAVTRTAAEFNVCILPSEPATLSLKTIESAVFTGTQTGFIGNVTGDLTGDVQGNIVGNSNGTHTGNVVGNSSTATAWNSSRTITISGDCTGSGSSSNGTNNISIGIDPSTIKFSSEMNKNGGSGTYNVTNTLVLAAGLFNIRGFGNDGYGDVKSLQGRINGQWFNLFGTGTYSSPSTSAQVVSDGTNVRLSGSGSYPYTKLFN